jgi:hypothetical protein
MGLGCEPEENAGRVDRGGCRSTASRARRWNRSLRCADRLNGSAHGPTSEDAPTGTVGEVAACARFLVVDNPVRGASPSQRIRRGLHVAPSDPCVAEWRPRLWRKRRPSSTAFPVHVDFPQKKQECLHIGQDKPRGSKSSPSFSIRRRTSLVSKRRSRGSFLVAHRSTSSGRTGVDTVGVGIARTE